MEDAQFSQKTPTSLLKLIRYRYLPYWPLYVALMFLLAIAAAVYLRYATPYYEITTNILLKDEKKGADDSQILEALNMYSSKKIVENEIEVLKSKALLREVVLNLYLYAPIYEEGRIKPKNAYITSPVTVKVQNPERLVEQAKVPFQYVADSNLVRIDNKTYALNQWVKTPYGIIKFTPNANQQAEATKPLYFSLINPKKRYNALAENIEVSAASKLSSILTIEYKDEVPQRGEMILNELVKAYQNQGLKVKDSMATNTLAFIDERIREVTDDLHNIEAKVQQYKSNKGIVNLSQQGQLFLQNVGTNDKQMSDITVQSAALDQVENYLSSNNGSGFIPSSVGISDPALNSMLEKLYNTELQYERLKKTTAENNPIMLALSNEIQNMRPKILESVRSNRKALQASQGSIASETNKYSTMLQSIPEKERELVEISRQQAIKNDVYAFLLRKREEAALLQVSTISDTRAIDNAESSVEPVSPKPKLIFAAALILALLIGIGYVSYKEFMNSKVLFRSQIEEKCSIPIVAEIAKSNSKNSLVVNDPKMIVLSEQFRHLRAAIGIFGKITKKKRILVTSSIPGEGKSFIANNLALSLAMSGRKVVMMDMDLRNPKTSNVFKLSGKIGMAQYLEESFDPAEIVYKTEFDNLFVIPAGSAEENATELMLHGNLRELMEYLESRFDYIVMDAAPVDPVTDAYVLSEFVTTTLYVVRHNYTPETMVELLDQNAKVKTLKNMAIVFNGIKPRGILMKGYGYGYGYGYNNVYGNKQYGSKQPETKA